jgi:hypothetical protein
MAGCLQGRGGGLERGLVEVGEQDGFPGTLAAGDAPEVSAREGHSIRISQSIQEIVRCGEEFHLVERRLYRAQALGSGAAVSAEIELVHVHF